MRSRSTFSRFTRLRATSESQIFPLLLGNPLDSSSVVEQAWRRIPTRLAPGGPQGLQSRIGPEAWRYRLPLPGCPSAEP